MGTALFMFYVIAEEYDVVASTDVWPRGVLVLPFYGKLLQEILTEGQQYQEMKKRTDTLEMQLFETCQ